MARIEMTESKDFSNSKVKTETKNRVMCVIEEALREEFGEVHWVRTGNGESKTKELAVRVGEVIHEDNVYDMCVTVNASAKDYRERTSAKGKVFLPFDYDEMCEAYDRWLEEKEAAAAAPKEKKKSSKKSEDIDDEF